MDFAFALPKLRILLIAVIVGLVIAGFGAEVRRDRWRAAGKAAAAAEAARGETLSGTIVGTDEAARTIVVEEAIGQGGLMREVKLGLAQDLVVTSGGASGSAKDLETGKTVTVRYSGAFDKLLAHEIRIGPAETASAAGDTAAPEHSESLPLLVKWFSLSEEKNFPTWWSSFLLLACSLALAVIARVKKRMGGAYRIRWLVLSAIFCYMSLDEFIEIHEYLNNLKPLRDRHGILYFGWVVPAAALVVIFAVAYIQFLFHLPLRTRIRVALAGVIYVGGALGVELLLGKYADVYGDDNFTYAMIDMIEETMEMAGSSLFLYSLLEYLGTIVPEMRVRIAGESTSR